MALRHSPENNEDVSADLHGRLTERKRVRRNNGEQGCDAWYTIETTMHDGVNISEAVNGLGLHRISIFFISTT